MHNSVFDFFNHRKAAWNDEGYAYAMKQYKENPTKETIERLSIQGSETKINSDDLQFNLGILRYLKTVHLNA